MGLFDEKKPIGRKSRDTVSLIQYISEKKMNENAAMRKI
jgi:hypothetical protein